MLQDDVAAKLPGIFAQSPIVESSRTEHGCPPLLDAAACVARIDEASEAWHRSDQPAASDLLLTLHRANFELWHLEDSARDPHATAQQIANVKHAIDLTNQRRNDCVESIDADLLQVLATAGLPQPDAPLHSETPGQIFDRLSILSLKRFHMAEESVRPSADDAHQSHSRDRLAVLQTQSADLAGCLSALWSDISAGQRRFKVYRQMKMYNDANLNPFLYRGKATAQTATRSQRPQDAV